MNNRFGFGQGNGRPSGIKPPSSFGPSGQKRAPLGSSSSSSSVPQSASSMASSRKTSNIGMHFPPSGGSAMTNSGARNRKSVYGNQRSNVFSSARKSVTAKIGGLFGLTPQHNRQSYLPNTASSAQSSRRSSMGGNRHIKDSRALSDASYQRQCVNKLLAFLTDNPYGTYPHQISKTLGTRPTVGEIARVFEFLFMCYGLKPKVTPMDIEIPKIMASLEYPFPVKKSDLVSFTSGRALGSVLGMLEWIVDSLNYLCNMDPERLFHRNLEDETDIKTELVNLCLRANAEEMDTEDVDTYLQEVVTKTYGTEDDFEQLVDEQENLKEELRKLDEEIEQTSNLPNSIQTYHLDIKNYDQYMNEMKAHHRVNEEVLEGLDKDINERKALIKKTEEQKRLLKVKVEEQEFGLEEAVLARERKQQLEDEIKQEFKFIDELKKSIRCSKLECSKYEDNIKKMHSDLESFINAMKDMVDSPVMSKYSSTLRQHLSSPQWTQILEALKNINGEPNGTDIVELEKVFSKRVNELKIAIVQHNSALKGTVSLSEQQRLNELNLKLEEKEKNLKQNEENTNQLMSELENTRKEQVSQVASMQSDIDRMRQMLSELDSNKQDDEELIKLRKEVEDKENHYKNERELKIKGFEDTVRTDKEGMDQVLITLDQLIAKAKEENTQLKELHKKF